MVLSIVTCLFSGLCRLSTDCDFSSAPILNLYQNPFSWLSQFLKAGLTLPNPLKNTIQQSHQLYVTIGQVLEDAKVGMVLNILSQTVFFHSSHNYFWVQHSECFWAENCLKVSSIDPFYLIYHVLPLSMTAGFSPFCQVWPFRIDILDFRPVPCSSNVAKLIQANMLLLRLNSHQDTFKWQS